MRRKISEIHTLGPKGTNCEKAAYHYIKEKKLDAEVILHDSLESAVEVVLKKTSSALLGCVVYPDLHNIVFSNLENMQLGDVFLLDTYEMVLASREGVESEIKRVASHPAPQNLVPEGLDIQLCSSNAQAAHLCSSLEVDGCITTSEAARNKGLKLVRDFGKVKMGFSIHVHH
ncbi:hypothetical protein MHO82_17450 [Vibrio sp. Of7-15]|uniref:hypothetical protein n=1 Tax=Vibrio sp. Of7-15 TaxID=2724879 RepID=UPI001EF223B3|nr:hypothetical protein [Vibrio sp. Of7-15]MCG7498656.1 hypothetical protein [Vibrio sp. Of7-15]